MDLVFNCWMTESRLLKQGQQTKTKTMNSHCVEPSWPVGSTRSNPYQWSHWTVAASFCTGCYYYLCFTTKESEIREMKRREQWRHWHLNTGNLAPSPPCLTTKLYVICLNSEPRCAWLPLALGVFAFMGPFLCPDYSYFCFMIALTRKWIYW